MKPVRQLSFETGLQPHVRQLSVYNMLQGQGTPSCRQGLPTSRAHGRACSSCHPWLLDTLPRSNGSGNPCRNDVLFLKLVHMGYNPRLS